MHPELSFSVIVLPCAMEVASHQETFLQIILRVNTWVINHLLQMPQSLIQVGKVNLHQVFILIFSEFTSLYDTCRDTPPKAHK